MLRRPAFPGYDLASPTGRAAARRFNFQTAKQFQTQIRDPAAQGARAVHVSFASSNRGRGECRVPAAPAASRAKVKQAHERRHWARSGRRASANLTPATGARTTRLHRPQQLRSSARRSIAHRSHRPALPSRHAPDAAASTASHPASVTIAIRPSVGWDSAGYRFDLGQARRGIFLERGLDRGNQIIGLSPEKVLIVSRKARISCKALMPPMWHAELSSTSAAVR
jgi:hypothetical protein